MYHLRDAIASIVKDVSEHGVAFALVGGLAVSARSEPRTTRDVDLAVAAATDDEAEQLVYYLQQRGYSVLGTVEQTGTGRLATARLRPPLGANGGAVVDLLFASSGIEKEIAESATAIEILRDVTVPVARIGHLMALKLLARDDDERPQDRIDLKALLAEADGPDIELARRSVALIEQRGYARGRDLQLALADLLQGR